MIAIGSHVRTQLMPRPTGRATEKRSTSSAGVRRLAGRADSQRGRELVAHVGGGLAQRGAIGQRDGAVALGQPLAVGAEHERHVGVAGGGEAEPRAEPQLARRGVQEVGAAHDLAHALLGVVDDDGQVVGERPVVAAHHEVVDDALHGPGDAVLEGHPRGVGADSQRRRAAGGLALGALRRGQAAAGPG